MNHSASSAQPSSSPTSEAWRQYPFDLVPGDPEFRFPDAETIHEAHQSDTWFIAGALTSTGGRRFAFLTMFNRNRPGGSLVADFHSMALFDIDHGTYGTYTDYDMPPKNTAPGSVPKLRVTTGHLDLSYAGRTGTAIWRTRRDSVGELVPYGYELVINGVDQDGVVMELRLDVSPTTAPVPVGASRYAGRFECLGQALTFSYFQTGMSMTGSLKWGDIDERVSGASGHVDRQWFPLPPGDGAAADGRNTIAHEWRTIHLDNGVDFVGWRQFDRHAKNATVPFTGATVTIPGQSPFCVEDVEVSTTSYVRWPESVWQLSRPLVAGRYLPDRHTLTSSELDLHLVGEPLVAVPAHALPVEYMEGPFHFRGRCAAKPSPDSACPNDHWRCIETGNSSTS